MPELPEVETTKRGIAPHIEGQTIQKVVVRNPSLRYPVPVARIQAEMENALLQSVERRGKYLLFKNQNGMAIGHLGMSGSMRIVDSSDTQIKKHDHIDLVFDNGKTLRYHDPRRFGLFLWHEGAPEEHPLIGKLGPEPLSDDFDTDYLFKKSRKKTVTIKQFIMNSDIVVGVGNIYASESLFMAGIKPTHPAGRVSKARYNTLVDKIKFVLDRSITQGGTTLKDFVNSDGNPGYFAQQLNVYGLEGKPCKQCGKPIKQKVLGQRATFYCTTCQT